MGRSILWYQFAGFGPWVVDFTLDLGGLWTLVVEICFGTKKNDFEMSRNEFWELFVHVITLWNMNFGLVLRWLGGCRLFDPILILA